MTGDDGDTSRLRTGPWLPEPAIHGTGDVPRQPDRNTDPVGFTEPAAGAADRSDSDRLDSGAFDAADTVQFSRIETPGRGRRGLLFGITAVVTLGTAVALSLATCSAPPDKRPARNPEGDVVPPVAAPASGPSSSASTRPSPTASRSASASASASVSASPSLSRSTSPAPFRPIELEAEAGKLDGAAQSVSYSGASGGRVVRDLGRQGGKKEGSLAFSADVPEAGTYTLTLYVALDGLLDGSRTAVVSVAGGATTSVPTTAGLGCCTPAKAQVTLAKGTNTVTIGNPDGHAPSLDRIVISAPTP